MAPLRAGVRGASVIGTAPFGRRKTMTIIAALGCSGIKATCLFDGPIDGDWPYLWIDATL